ncbi:MAG: polysaccharide biosynthesis C-terminal domain-containing protein [Clostridia bacterium]|nr:polysaccharide biosynthesis C-terminal domain-containing protein [Clostridia bacterium]
MKDLTKGNISKNLWALALPTLIAAMFNYALSVIDQVMLGKIVGDVGLAAVGATRSYFNILWGIEGSLVFAFGSHLAVLVGQGDGGSIRRAYKINMRMNLLFGFAIAACSIAFWRPLFSFLNVPADVFDEAKRYYVVYAASFMLFVINGNLSTALVSFGNSLFPMRVGVVSGVCNVALNYVLIVPCKMGAAGAALATLIVSLGSCAAYVLKLRAELNNLEGERARVSVADYAPIFRLVLPTALQQMMMHLLSFVVQPSINMLGKTSIAAIAVGDSVFGIIMIGYKHHSRGLSVLTGQALGHGQPSLSRKGVRITVRQILMLTAPVVLLLLIFPRVAAFLFLDDPYGETAMLSIHYIYCCIPFAFALAFSNMFHNFFRGVLRPGMNIVGGLALGITRAVLTISLIPVIGVYGAYIGYSAGWTADFLAMWIIYLSKKWKTKDYLELERAERAAQQSVT